MISREIWARLWELETTNRLNLVTAYLVLLAGTGSDHQLTKWSSTACEVYAGIGKPRAQHSIEELIRSGLIARTDVSTRLMPQYRLPAVPLEEEPIFLPVQLVTGLDRETPILRRVRETGDGLLLRMLVDLYGLIQLDATHGIPLINLRRGAANGTQKIREIGVHGVWGLSLGTSQNAQGDWVAPHRIKTKDPDSAWNVFWERVALLKKIGAIWFEPWVFDGEDVDAEPLFPVDLGVFYSSSLDDEVAELTRLIHATSIKLLEDQPYLIDQHSADLFLPLAAHRRPPALRGVARLRVEADTPGRRLSYAKRMSVLELGMAQFGQLYNDAAAGNYARPISTATQRLAG